MPPPWGHRTVATLALYTSLLGQQCVNVWSFEHKPPDPIDDAGRLNDCQWLIDDWIAHIQGAWATMTPGALSLVRLVAQVQQPRRLAPVEHVYDPGAVGAIGGDVPNPSAAAVIQWRSLYATRFSRGRSYIPGLTAGMMAGGKLTGAQIALYKTFADAMVARYGDGSVAQAVWDFTIYSRPYDHEYYTKRVNKVLTVVDKTNYAGNSSHVVSGRVDPTIRTQRRRELGVGA
jgi:hypothetical protein